MTPLSVGLYDVSKKILLKTDLRNLKNQSGYMPTLSYEEFFQLKLKRLF